MGSKNVKFKDTFVNHRKYLGKRENSIKIYRHPPRNIILLPFNLKFDDIDKLLVVNIEDDPIYYRIELQVTHVNDKESPIVLLHRKDSMVDIYYADETAINTRRELLKDLYTNASFNQQGTMEFEFLFDETGLDVFLLLEDKIENKIELAIKENTGKRELVSILAPTVPIGKHPESFPIVFLDKFGMVLKENTKIEVRIDGKELSVAEMPIKINGNHVYAAHYSLNPLTSYWNSNYLGGLDPIILTTPSDQVKVDNCDINLRKNSDYYEIVKFSGRDNKERKIIFEFSPPIPNLLYLKKEANVFGRFSCLIDEQRALFGGEYHIKHVGNTLAFTITPSIGRQPFPGKLWLKSYKWTSLLEFHDNGDITTKSIWW